MPEIDFDLLLAERAEAQRRNPALFERIASILHEHDPMGLITAEPGEYENETGTIMRRLDFAHDETDVQHILQEEMAFWFGEGAVHPDEGYAGIGREVWKAWEELR